MICALLDCSSKTLFALRSDFWIFKHHSSWHGMVLISLGVSCYTFGNFEEGKQSERESFQNTTGQTNDFRNKHFEFRNETTEKALVLMK
jgi:hypothetical protein